MVKDTAGDRARSFLQFIKKEQIILTALFFVTSAAVALGIWQEPRLAALTLFFYIPIVMTGIYFRFKKAIYLYGLATIIYFGMVVYYFNFFGDFTVPRMMMVLLEITTFYLIGYMMHRFHHIAYLAYQDIYDQAMEDPLTGIYNKRYFDLILEHEIIEAKRYKHNVALAFVDIDGLKKYNDRFGHPTADYLICQFADLLQELLRSSDVLCRWGGDEFTIILPHTPEKQAMILAKRIRQKILKHTFKLPDKKALSNFSISIGVAGYPYSAYDKKSLIEQADMALFRAKKVSERIFLLPPLEE